MMVKGRYRISIELFTEKTGDVVRLIRFHNELEFNEFIKSFNAMRYPGYAWRYKEKAKKKEKPEESIREVNK